MSIEKYKMPHDDCTPVQIGCLPNEIFVYIFSLLPAKQLINCRKVCLRWKLIIDNLARSDVMWRRHCENDFNKVYLTARNQARPGLLWYHIYRSLASWPRLHFAREMRDEFASASNVNEEIRDFKVLPNGIIGVHKRSCITYYDIETLEKSNRGTINGEYLRYNENHDYMVILNYSLDLFVIRKYVGKCHFEANATFHNVKTFLLMNSKLYYVNMSDEIYECELTEAGVIDRLIKRSGDGVMCLGHSNNHLNILTFQRSIYKIVNNDIVFVCELGANSNLLLQLREYNFLEQLDWRIYFQWMYVLNHTVPPGPLREIVTVRSYGDVILVGSSMGVLRIYYAPSEEFDLFNAVPIKQYNFMERSDCPVLSMCPIIQIDVLEAEDGHTVVVAMPKKIAVLDFVHGFKRSASVAMLPYRGIQKVKILKIDDSNC